MDSNEIKKTFFFFSNEDESEKYFCPCGQHFSVNKKKMADEAEEHVIKIDNNAFKNFDVDDFLNSVDLESDAQCPSCQKTASYFKKQGLKFPINNFFYKSFKYEETAERIMLHKILYRAIYESQIDFFEIEEVFETIFIDKESKNIGIKKGEKEVQLDLENMFDSIQEFFEPSLEKSSVKITDNFMDIHIFIGRLTNHIRDSKNINLLSGLLEEINGSRGLSMNTGMFSLIKITCVLLAIAKHENLATIALVKSGIFLFELLKDCELPKASVLKELNLTKPIQIFNYLINLEAKKAQDKIDKNDKKLQKYGFKSVKLQSGIEVEIDTQSEFYKETLQEDSKFSKVKREADGTMTLKESLVDKKISPFFFKKIKTVAEYKALIRYCKFVDYNELMNIIMKYDSSFLINLFNFLEYRNDVDSSSINYFFTLYGDFFSKKDSDYYGEEFKDYLIYFDDAKRILASLKWNIKRELMGIKKCSELKKYHDWLIKQYNNTVEKKESKIKYQNFVDKYKALEEYVHDDIEVKLIDTVEGLLFWAKQLNNSAAAYAINVERGIYLMAMVNYKTFKSDPNTGNLKNFMLGLNVDKRGMLEFDQFKSTNNQLATNKLKLILLDYLQEKDISYRELEDLSMTEVKISKAKQSEFMYSDNLSIEDVNFTSDVNTDTKKDDKYGKIFYLDENGNEVAVED